MHTIEISLSPILHLQTKIREKISTFVYFLYHHAFDAQCLREFQYISCAVIGKSGKRLVRLFHLIVGVFYVSRTEIEMVNERCLCAHRTNQACNFCSVFVDINRPVR